MATERPNTEGGMLKDGRGFSLVEVLTVITVVAALMGLAFLSFAQMQKRYTEEQQVKQLHADLLETRLRAMQHGRNTFVSLTSTTFYRTYEDTDTPPDGDGVFSAATDSLLKTVNMPAMSPPHSWVKSISTATLVTFTDKGLLSSGTPTLWIRIDPSAGAEFDCVVISEIKTGMGSMNGTNCVVK